MPQIFNNTHSLWEVVAVGDATYADADGGTRGAQSDTSPRANDDVSVVKDRVWIQNARQPPH